MTNAFHIKAVPGAPVACDMSTARDTPDERLAAYEALFEHALLRRERGAGAVVFRFRSDPGTRDAVEALARREAACCPFLDSRVETAADEVIWTITNTVTGDQRAAVDVVLDAFHALPVEVGLRPGTMAE